MPFNECVAASGGSELANKNAVHLEDVEREVAEVAERGITCPEVVDCDAYAELPEAVENAESGLRVVEERASCDFKLNVIVRKPGTVDEFTTLRLHHCRGSEPLWCEVDRDAKVGQAAIEPAAQRATCGFEHPPLELVEQADVLGDAKGLGRWNEAASRVLPSDPCFERLGATVLEAHDRLVVTGGTGLLRGPVGGCSRKSQAIGGQRVQRRDVVLRLVPAVALRAVESRLSLAEKRWITLSGIGLGKSARDRRWQ